MQQHGCIFDAKLCFSKDSWSVIYKDTTLEVLKDLKEKFSQNNGSRLFQLEKDIAAISQGDLSITNHFTQLKVYSLLIQDERQKSIDHLAEAYVESTALATKINTFGGYGGFRNSYGINNSSGKSYKNKGKERPMCSHCGTYHIMEKCYKLHGYPPRYKAKGKKLMGNQVGNSEIGANFRAMDSDSMPMQ